jgi:hypothetical protein
VLNPKVYAIGNSLNSEHRHKRVQSIVTLRLGRQVDNKVDQEDEDFAEPQGQESGKDERREVEPTTV